jgi:hypothetical protein
MRREGGWIRVYRAHHKADTMVTAGHIAKAMRDQPRRRKHHRRLHDQGLVTAGPIRCDTAEP